MWQAGLWFCGARLPRRAMHCTRPWGATTRRAIPLCRGGQWPPGADKAPPCRGRSPSGGERPFLFLRKKKRSFTPRRRKVRTTPFPPCGENSVPLPCASSPHKSCAFVGPPGPVFGEFGVEHGGLRLYALFGDQPRPLRPSHSGTGTSFGSIRPPPAGAALVTGVQLLIVQV